MKKKQGKDGYWFQVSYPQFSFLLFNEREYNRSMKKLQILFWKTFAKFWDLRPRLHLPKYRDYPIASCPTQEEYDYSSFKEVGMKILFEWDEKGHHWVAFTRQ